MFLRGVFVFLFYNSFCKGFINRPSIKPSRIGVPQMCDFHTPLILEYKIDGLINITRIKENFVPTSIMVGLSGYLANKDMLFSPQFWSAFSIVHIISSASMIINDLFDIEIDRVNNPGRPLINGSIRKEEAMKLAIILFSMVPLIGNTYLPSSVSPFWWGGMALVLLYTPILKRIFFIKNLACATLVSSTVPFIAFSLDTLNSPWITLTFKTIFMASLYIELLLDITDVKGDKENGVLTLPTVLGKEATLLAATTIISAGWFNTLSFLYSHRIPTPIFTGILLAYSPFYLNLWRIWRTQGSPSIINNAIKQTTVSLLLYFFSIIIETSIL
jgi:geranylgeranylglycerol-phosphate geranylgeranyltransferase